MFVVASFLLPNTSCARIRASATPAAQQQAKVLLEVLHRSDEVEALPVPGPQEDAGFDSLREDVKRRQAERPPAEHIANERGEVPIRIVAAEAKVGGALPPPQSSFDFMVTTRPMVSEKPEMKVSSGRRTNVKTVKLAAARRPSREHLAEPSCS